MDKGLNVKEKLVFEFIKKQVIKNGYAPTMREICEETGIKSTACVYNHMVSLRKKGYIAYETKRSRTLKILKENEDKLSELETYKKANDNLLVKNAELRVELETYKKIAEKLADTILEIDVEEQDVYEKICKNLPSLRCDEIEEGRCDKCIIDWARKEVENEKE